MPVRSSIKPTSFFWERKEGWACHPSIPGAPVNHIYSGILRPWGLKGEWVAVGDSFQHRGGTVCVCVIKLFIVHDHSTKVNRLQGFTVIRPLDQGFHAPRTVLSLYIQIEYTQRFPPSWVHPWRRYYVCRSSSVEVATFHQTVWGLICNLIVKVGHWHYRVHMASARFNPSKDLVLLLL